MPVELSRLDSMIPLETPVDWKMHNDLFFGRNIIVNAHVREASYRIHPDVLSVKCAFHGEEHYFGSNFYYKVDDAHYLIFNHGKSYGSTIDAKEDVESFTVHFSPAFEYDCYTAITASGQKLLDDPFFAKTDRILFSENLQQHDSVVSPVLFKLRALSKDFDAFTGEITETYFDLYSRMVARQKDVNQEMMNLPASRISTKKELFKRLNVARDYIKSCYKKPITLEEVAGVACLNRYYFLRQFRKAFNVTPHQYLIDVRLKEAVRLLGTGEKTVTEICHETGFSDLASFSKIFKKHYACPPTRYVHRSGDIA